MSTKEDQVNDKRVAVEKEFLRKMHEDLLDIIKRRHNTVLAKVIVLASLFGIGGMPGLSGITFSKNAYWVVPIVVLAFDLIYVDLMYALRRITVFFITSTDADVGELERDWEWWVHGASYSTERQAKLGPPDGKHVIRSAQDPGSPSDAQTSKMRNFSRRLAAWYGNWAHLWPASLLVSPISIIAAFILLYLGMKPCPEQYPSLAGFSLFFLYIIVIAAGYGVLFKSHSSRGKTLKAIVREARWPTNVWEHPR